MPARSTTVLAGIVLSGVLAALATGGGRPGPASGAPAPPVLVTPLLSVRRLPDWIEREVAGQQLAAALPSALAPLGAARKDSCLVVDRGDDVLFASHPTQAEVPASNLKLLTATAVLDKLGSGARVTTRVTATGRTGSTVHGSLYLVGSGDPLLWTRRYDLTQVPPEPLYTSLSRLADRVRAAGVRRIDGGVVGDESLFDTRRAVPSWKPSYVSDDDVGPLSALDVDNGFRLSEPAGPAARPAVLAANVFTNLLIRDGVVVVGHTAAGRSPADATSVTSIRSAPLGAVVGAVLRVSDDTGAELLTKLLGRRFGSGGSTSAGTAVVRSDLAADGLPVSQLTAVDGSGLSRLDRVSCTLIADDLRREGTGGPVFAGLPVAGRTGTLALRFVDTPAAGRVHAKTGTLDGVSALSGFVLAATGRGAPTAGVRQPLAFSFIANDLPDDDTGVEVADAVGVALAEYPRVAPIADAEPLIRPLSPHRRPLTRRPRRAGAA